MVIATIYVYSRDTLCTQYIIDKSWELTHVDTSWTNVTINRHMTRRSR